jgi:hypothetical protein
MADHRDYPCWGCGREANDHTRARFSTPLGTTTIRVCATKECAAAGTEALRAKFEPGDTLRCLEVHPAAD